MSAPEAPVPAVPPAATAGDHAGKGPLTTTEANTLTVEPKTGAPDVAPKPAPAQAAPIFAEYETRLFALYTRFRYNELVCRRLMIKALGLEKAVRWSVLVTLAISLFSGVIPGMNQATLNWVWGSFTTAATLLTFYSLMEGSGDKQFRWFQLAMRFHASANKVEFFSTQVRRGKVTEDELAESWREFTVELDGLVDGAGPAFLEFEAKHQSELSDELAATLKRENRAA